MRTPRRCLLTLGLILTEGSIGLGQSAAGGSQLSRTESEIQIRVRIHNNVDVQADILARAEQVATQILSQAGVRAVWFDCSATVAVGQRQPLCDHPLEATDLLLDFDEDIRSMSSSLRENTLGFALIPATGEGNRAFISNRRVHATARRFDSSLAMILGLAVAHEIGHLLMNSHDHSASGLMRAGWDVNDLTRAARSDLRFTDNELKQVHAGAVTRMTRQNAAQVEATISH